MNKYKSYSGKMDRQFFNAHDITVIQHQPWQFSLFHPDLKPKQKFVWYPRKGTLMFEWEMPNGESGIKNLGRFEEPEEVYQIIMNKINEE